MKNYSTRLLILRIASLVMIMGLAVLQLGKPVTAQVLGNDILYTTDEDFDQGTLVSVNHDAPNNDQLQLNSPTEPFPFINVAASGRGTVVRIHTETGEILGEYRTAPEGRGLDPSRTTVDLFGNVWTGNREEVGEIDGVPHGSAVKIGLIVGGTRVDADNTPNPTGDYLAPPFGYNTCADRDSDGLIKTSRGLGDIRLWPDITDGVGGTDGVVEDADDECILIYQRLPNVLMVRHLSVDANNDVWVGDAFSWLAPGFVKLSENTGEILDVLHPPSIECGGYGGLVDGNGVLWSASRWWVLRYDPSTGIGTCVQTLDSYGMGIDTNGYIWYSLWPNEIGKLAPDGSLVPGYPKWIGVTGGEARGVAVTLVDNHVWVVSSGSNTVSRLDNNGNVLKVIPVDGWPTGVAVDAGGKVWVVSRPVVRIDPNGGDDGLGAVDLTVSLGWGASPYNYSDMTGIVAISQTSPQGFWTVVQDSQTPGFEWGRIIWNTEPEGNEPPGTAIIVEARAADTEAGLGGQIFQPVLKGDLFSMFGRYIEVRATLKASSEGVSPVLSDIRIQPHVIFVDIDIKPGSYPNSINCENKKEVITVAVLTTEDFDALSINHTTVTFEGASEIHVNKKTGEPQRHEEDVDLDGDMDLVFHFRLGDTTLGCGSEAGTLTGGTYDGIPVRGTDSIRMVKVGDCGYTSDSAGLSCQDILDRCPGTQSGEKWIEPDGTNAILAYCNMDEEGNGWTLIYNRNNAYFSPDQMYNELPAQGPDFSSNTTSWFIPVDATVWLWEVSVDSGASYRTLETSIPPEARSTTHATVVNAPISTVYGNTTGASGPFYFQTITFWDKCLYGCDSGQASWWGIVNVLQGTGDQDNPGLGGHTDWCSMNSMLLAGDNYTWGDGDLEYYLSDWKDIGGDGIGGTNCNPYSPPTQYRYRFWAR